MDNFQVAENYEEIVKKSQHTKSQWNEARNNLLALESSLRNIEKSLVEQPDLTSNDVIDLYNKAKHELPDSVKKQLDDVTEFHEKLVLSRNQRLVAEKQKISRSINELALQIAELEKKKDEFMHYLGSHGALTEYEALVNRLNECNRIAEKLSGYKELTHEYKRRAQECKLELDKEIIRTTEYLEISKTHLNMLSDRFRSMAKRVYPNHLSGLTIENNEGENLERFNIEAHIHGDASDGISETKLFCFEMTILTTQKNHKMKFLAHDSRLYHGIDPRQRIEIFRIASEYCTKQGLQYIAAINEDNLESMREVMDEKEYDDLFMKNRILELTDESDEGKLLGIKIDLDYAHS